MEQPKRRLSAIWFADIVGYSELSTRDEPAAFRLVDLLQTLCREIVATYEGRIVKFIGDAVLSEFASTDSAVRSAVSLQERFVEQAAALGQPAQLRIGVHLGEVTATPDGDLYGDGINTASRLHHTAEPGRVVISEDVWRLLRQRPEFRFAPLGAVELRGITTRVEVYDVLFGSRAALAPQALPIPATVSAPPQARRSRAAWIVAAVALTAAGAAALFFLKPGDAPPDGSQPAVTQQAPPVTTPSSTSAPASAPAPRPDSGSARIPPAATPSPRVAREPVTANEKPPPPSPTTQAAPAVPESAPSTAGTPPPGSARANVPPIQATSPFAPHRVRALLDRLAAATTSERPREALAALGPGAAVLGGRGGQQLREMFGQGLALRIGRVDPVQIASEQVTIRFVLHAKSTTRPEVPIVYIGVIDRNAGGELQFKELRRDLEGRRGGRGTARY